MFWLHHYVWKYYLILFKDESQSNTIFKTILLSFLFSLFGILWNMIHISYHNDVWCTITTMLLFLLFSLHLFKKKQSDGEIIWITHYEDIISFTKFTTKMKKNITSLYILWHFGLGAKFFLLLQMSSL